MRPDPAEAAGSTKSDVGLTVCSCCIIFELMQKTNMKHKIYDFLNDIWYKIFWKGMVQKWYRQKENGRL